jgi:alkyl sulfatase BDS1-like metallo-beta-lactamase superfamily hydrolase
MEPSFDDVQSFHDADRGFVDRLDPCTIKDGSGRVIWDNEAYNFLSKPVPESASPKLWRQAQLVAKQGLYKVVDGIYQIRGFDLSNMTVIEGTKGIIVIDPLTSAECAKAALELYSKNRGNKAVMGMLYTHSHADHFGGAEGILSRSEATQVPVIAPHGFLEHAVSENIFAGNAMARRAGYMYGNELPKGPRGQISAGLGATVSSGTITIVPPNLDVTHTGQTEIIDGVELIFQVTPGTEAPAEMNFFLPQFRTMCMAENATQCLHNISTLRGAAVRDALAWSSYLDESIALYAEKTEVAFASHHWPTWGKERVYTYLTQQRDLYAFLHDQTVRLMNQGLTGIEIAEDFSLPPKLRTAWHTQGFYGSVSHNIKAIYQRYMTWFDGNPSHLWEHPPVESAKRYVDCMGGAEEVIKKAQGFIKQGDLRFAATLLNHVVFSDPENAAGKIMLASTYEKLGFGSENGPWRNFYLSGAGELRGQTPHKNLLSDQTEMLQALSLHQLFASIAVRIDGSKAQTHDFTIDLYVIDRKEKCRLIVSNGALIHRTGLKQGESQFGTADYSCSMSHTQLLILLATGHFGDIECESGDRSCFEKLLSFIVSFDEKFNIVLP